MKIFEAYLSKTLRSHFKDFIDAEGHSVMTRDKIHYRFGVYLTRMKGVNYDALLMQAATESEFREKLETIFYEKWVNHIGYPEIPQYFFIYLDYLRFQCEAQDDLDIEGLEHDYTTFIPREGVLSRFEERFLTSDKKLRLLANPALIKSLKDMNLWANPVSAECVDKCIGFYQDCGLDMSRDDWENLLKNAIGKNADKSRRGSVAIEIIDAGGERKVMNMNQAFEYVINLIGIEQVAKCRLVNNGQPILLEGAKAKSKSSFKVLTDKYYLNCRGNTTERFKTLRALVLIYHLQLQLNLTNEKTPKSPRRILKNAKSDKEAALQAPVKPAPPRVTPIPSTSTEDTSIDYGNNGVLNLFDD